MKWYVAEYIEAASIANSLSYMMSRGVPYEEQFVKGWRQLDPKNTSLLWAPFIASFAGFDRASRGGIRPCTWTKQEKCDDAGHQMSRVCISLRNWESLGHCALQQLGSITLTNRTLSGAHWGGRHAGSARCDAVKSWAFYYWIYVGGCTWIRLGARW